MGKKDKYEGFRPGTADYIKAGTAPAHYPVEDIPEVAFVGRSNVGKSTLINLLTARKSLARTSRTPGRTQLIQFFRVSPGIIFADFPGYGFAMVPKAIRRQWGPMITTYLKVRDKLCAVVLIVDIRRDPQKRELEILDWLEQNERNVLIVATKLDKIGPNKRMARIKALAADLGVPKDSVFPFSALSGEGRMEIWEALLGVADYGGK
jgi:GTP-binding protein